jgi:hypothetical protein
MFGTIIYTYDEIFMIFKYILCLIYTFFIFSSGNYNNFKVSPKSLKFYRHVDDM